MLSLIWLLARHKQAMSDKERTLTLSVANVQYYPSKLIIFICHSNFTALTSLLDHPGTSAREKAKENGKHGGHSQQHLVKH